MKTRLLQNRNGPLWVWRHPQPGRQYGIGVDTAAGVRGGDPCVAEVVDMETNEQVAEWYGWQQPHDFGRTVYLLGEMYEAEVAIETHPSAHGLAVYDACEAAGCKRLFVQTTWNTRESRFIQNKGWNTNQQSKAVLLARVARALADGVAVHSERLLQELIEAQLDDNDRIDEKRQREDARMSRYCRNDCIIAFGIALKLSDFALEEQTAFPKPKPPPPTGSDAAFWESRRRQRGVGVRYDQQTGYGL